MTMSDSFNMKESLRVSCPLSTFSSTLAQANALIVLLKWKRWSPFMDSCSPDFVSNTVTPTRHPCFSKKLTFSSSADANALGERRIILDANNVVLRLDILIFIRNFLTFGKFKL
ncbi:hypothetical protein D3C76_1314720 [compost metagenome]